MVLAGALGGGAALGLLVPSGHGWTPAVTGPVVAMLGTLTLPPGDRRTTLRRLLRVGLAAAVVATLSALLAPWPVAAFGALLAVIAAAAWVSGAGPAEAGLGLVAFFACALPLAVEVGPADAPWLAAAALTGAIAAAVVAVLVLPDRPARQLRRTAPALDARLDDLVDAVVVTLVHGVDRAARAHLLERLAAVQDVALQLDGLIELLTHDRALPALERLREEVLWTEILADHLAWSVLARPGAQPDRDEADRLVATWASPGAAARPGALLPADARPGPSTTAAIVARLAAGRSVRAPDTWAPDTARAARAAADRVPAPLPSTAPSRSPWAKVVQATLASAVALALGLALFPRFWTWAVIGAFVVVLTTPNRGAAVRKAVDRTLGTAAGVAAGLALGTLLGGLASIELVVVVGALFATMWVLQVSHAWQMLLTTVVVALLYDVMGLLSPDVLVLRLATTTLGALVGGLVAWFVLPSSTRSALDGDVVTVLDALDDVLLGLAEGVDETARFERIRRLDRAVAALRAHTAPLVTAAPFRIADEVRAARLLVASARFRARALATAVPPDGAGAAPGDAAVLAAVRHRLHALRARLAPDGARVAPATGDLSAGQGPIADVLRALDARLAAFLDARDPRRARS